MRAGRILLFAALAGAAVLLAHLFVFQRDLGTTSVRVLRDTDSYSWMNRAIYLAETGNWFEHTYPRVNPPEGLEQHWTRPMDAVLLVGGSVLGLFTGFRDGLYLWGFLLPPLLHVLSLFVLIWCATPLLRKGILKVGDLPLLILVLLTQLSVWGIFLAGRPDHHALLALIFLIHIGLWLRLVLDDERGLGPAVGLGLVGALAIWISVEALIFVTVGMGGLGLLWLTGHDRERIARRNAVYGAALFVGLAAATVIEWGPRGLDTRPPDTLSVSHLGLAGLAAVFWSFLWLTSRRSIAQRLSGRLAIAGAGVSVVLVAILLAFRDLLASPLAEVDPVYRATRLIRIAELQSTPSTGVGAFGAVGMCILLMATGAAALAYLTVRLRRDSATEKRVVWLMFAVLVVVYLILTWEQVRWSDYLALSAVVPYSLFVIGVLRVVGDRVQGRRLMWMRPTVLTALIAGYLVFGLALSAFGKATLSTEEGESDLQTRWAGSDLTPTMATATLESPREKGECDLARISDVLMDEAWFAQPELVLAHTDYGPELLYRTHHSVLSIPNHRRQSGYRFSRDVLGHRSPKRAAELLRERGVGILVLCAHDLTSGFYRFPGEHRAFVDWLSDGGMPEGYALHVSTPVVRVYRLDD